MYRFKDVIFSKKALNYKEGRWEMKNNEQTFLSNRNLVRADSEVIEGFISLTN